MSPRSEMADLMDADRELDRYVESRQAFRDGNTRPYSQGGRLGFGTPGNAVARAVLAVLGKLEEVEVEECNPPDAFSCRSSHWLRMPDDKHFGQPNFSATPRTVYMRKKEPAPDVGELARRAVKAWRGSHGSLNPVNDAMDALEAGLEK